MTRWWRMLGLMAVAWSSALPCDGAVRHADTGYLAGKIQVTIELDRSIYHTEPLDEGVFITATYTNISADTVELGHPLIWGNHRREGEYFALFDEAGNEIPVSGHTYIGYDLTELTDVVLAPGESWWARTSLDWSGHDRYYEVPGHYSVQMRYYYYDFTTWQDGMSEEQGRAWQDANRYALYSNIVPFEVIEAGAKAPKQQPEVKVAVGKTRVKPKLRLYRVRGQLVSSADVLEKAGVKVKTDKQSVTLTRGKRQIEFALQRNKAKVNGKWQRIPVAAMRSQGEVILPLKLATQALGIRTSWDQAHSTLRLNVESS